MMRRRRLRWPDLGVHSPGELLERTRLAWRLLRDDRVSPMLKVIPLVGLVYLIWPVDLLPDVFPVLGQLDDVAVLILAINAFIRACPPEVVETVRRDMSSISAAYRVDKDESPDR